MPIHRAKGGWQWGSHGKVYRSRKKAAKQAAAAYANGYREHVDHLRWLIDGLDLVWYGDALQMEAKKPSKKAGASDHEMDAFYQTWTKGVSKIVSDAFIKVVMRKYGVKLPGSTIEPRAREMLQGDALWDVLSDAVGAA